jgi:hypothetical protein
VLGVATEAGQDDRFESSRDFWADLADPLRRAVEVPGQGGLPVAALERRPASSS